MKSGYVYLDEAEMLLMKNLLQKNHGNQFFQDNYFIF